MAELATLKAITFRIASTPAAQLPQQIPAIAASLSNCRLLLSSSAASGSKNASEASVAIHKFRALLRSLLEDRTPHGRWSAVVLVKATLEVGGWETLQHSLQWVRALLGMLKKPDPPSSKKLCLVTLTRIFILTRKYPTLVREITTPTLPAYIQTCLQVAATRPSAALFQVILESFTQLLPRHPTVFRPYVKQLRQTVEQFLAPTPSSKLSKEQLSSNNSAASSDVCTAARRLFVQLPSCAPKGGAGEEWDKSLIEVIANAHRVADRVFRAVMEDWKPMQSHVDISNGQTLDSAVEDTQKDSNNLPPWSGIYAGGERLVGALRLIKEYYSAPTTGVVNLRVGHIMDLVTRMFSLTVPSASTGASLSTVRLNNQVSKEEREHLWIILPEVHIATIELVDVLASRCEDNASAIDAIVLDQLVWVFGAERTSWQIRASCYQTLAQILARSGSSLSRSSIDSMTCVLRTCCKDILSQESNIVPDLPAGQDKANNTNQNLKSVNADAFLSSSQLPSDNHFRDDDLRQAASQLLPKILLYIRPQQLSDSLRTRMDRVSILTKHKAAMIASVLNPPPSKRFGKPAASIFPFLARLYANETDVEALMRPRMPILRTGLDLDSDVGANTGEKFVGDKEIEDHFIGQELDTLLESEAHMAQETSLPEPGATVEETVANDEASLLTQPPSGPAQNYALEHELTTNVTKRMYPTEVDLGPSKRAKFETEAPGISTRPTKLSTETTSHGGVPTASITQLQNMENPAVATIAGRHSDDDDDNDDFGELVLGQDTDEEGSDL